LIGEYAIDNEEVELDEDGEPILQEEMVSI